MAFVIRSSKNLEEQIKPNKEYNFYENFNLLSEIFKKYSKQNSTNKSKAAFGTKAIRKTLDIQDGSKSPGPGSYKVQKEFVKKSFHQNLTTPNDPEGLEGEPAQLFISKDRRFKQLNTSNKNNPSPCEYFKNKKSFDKNLHLQDLSQLKNFGVYEPYSSKRKITIPSTTIFYDLKDNGDIEIKQNLEELRIKKNLENLGPGSYDPKSQKKNNNSIDWSKSVKDDGIEKEKNKERKEKKIMNDIRELKINTEENYNPYNNSKIKLDNAYDDKSNNSTNLLSYNIESMAEKMFRSELIQEEEKKKKDKYGTKIEDLPGPGQYNTSININAPISFSNQTNFGSNVSRGLMVHLGDNKIRIGQKEKKNKIVIKLDNRSEGKHKKDKLNNSSKIEENDNSQVNNKNTSYLAHSLYVNELKERNIRQKKSFLKRLGPGSYNPTLPSDKKDNYIQSFNTLEKRFTVNKDQTLFPGVGTYSTLDLWIPKKSGFQSMVPHNITQRHSNGISAPKILETKDQIYYEKHKQPCVGDYYPEMRSSIEYNLYKNIINFNDKKPCFNTAERRFFEFKKKYEDESYIGKYNIAGKEKEFTQRTIPFLSNVEKDGFKSMIDKINDNKDVGPGAYRYDSYFDWNKKSYNMLFA